MDDSSLKTKNNLSLKIADKYIETLDFMFLSHNYKKGVEKNE